MSTRLDRLVYLLDTGSKQEVRSTAARQIGIIAKQKPEEFENLLYRVSGFLRSKAWESRIAAGWAIECLAKNVNFKVDDESYDSSVDEKECLAAVSDFLNFENFDIEKVCHNGVPLLASSGREYDFTSDDTNSTEMMAKQRKALKQKLGLGTHFMDSELLEDSDIINQPNQAPKAQEKPLEPVQGPENASNIILSTREVNRLKRKARMAEKERLLAAQSNKESACQNKVEISYKRTENIARVKPGHWPFEKFCEKLLIDLFSPNWHTRHGAAVGLREIMKEQGKYAGMVLGLKPETNGLLHNMWLENITIHLLCVLALDKFGDYGSDQTVAPVRELAAQALGALLRWASPELCLKVVNLGLFKLLTAGENELNNGKPSMRDSGWQMSHGALVGLKYCMVVRKDLLRDFICDENGQQNAIYKAMIKGLQDTDEDVRSIASSTMLLISNELVSIISPDVIYSTIVTTLWKCLVELDDITSATAFVMNLLSKLMMAPGIAEIMKNRQDYSVKMHVSLLYSFLRHTLLSVRIAALNAIATFSDLTIEDKNAFGGEMWVSKELLIMIFQNFFLDDNEEDIHKSLEVWKKLLLCVKKSSDGIQHFVEMIVKECFPTWIALISTPIGSRIDPSLIYIPQVRSRSIGETKDKFVAPHDDAMLKQDLAIIKEDHLILTRLSAASALGHFAAAISDYWCDSFSEIIWEALKPRFYSPLVSERQFGCVFLEEFAKAQKEIAPNNMTIVKNFLSKCISDESLLNLDKPFFCKELEKLLMLLRADCKYLLHNLKKELSIQIPRLQPIHQFDGSEFDPNLHFTVDHAIHVATDVVPKLIEGKTLSPKSAQNCDDVCKLILSSSESYIALSEKYEFRWKSLLSSVIVTDLEFPKNMGSVIKSLMNALRKEKNINFQRRAANSVAHVIDSCVKQKKSKGLVSKIVTNLCLYISNNFPVPLDSDTLSIGEGILSIKLDLPRDKESANDFVKSLESDPNAFKQGLKMDNLGKKTFYRKKPNTDNGSKSDPQKKLRGPKEIAQENNSQYQDPGALDGIALASRGAIFAIGKICECLGPNLSLEINSIWEYISSPFCKDGKILTHEEMLDLITNNANDHECMKKLCSVLHALSEIVNILDKNILNEIEKLVLPISACVRAPLAVVRFIASRCLALVCSSCTDVVMRVIIEHVLPFLNDKNDIYRSGTSECIYCVMRKMDCRILDYVTLFVVPIVKRMSDPVERIRFLCSNVFAQLIELTPLESEFQNSSLSEDMIGKMKEERQFLSQLVGIEKIEHIDLGVKIEAKLRSYQIEGINWLAFLNRYNLHGILCDDMGLGKTLQTICIMAASHHGSIAEGGISLVVCPSTLTTHWFQEIKKFAPFMNPLIYRGNFAERIALRPQIPNHDVIISSYDILRNDLEFMSSMNYNYYVLDEGHIIKNPKTKITIAAKALKASHKLILSGTPIQNNFMELWSLFDFLMPGFLGTYSEFNEKFRKPFVGPIDSKKSDSENEKRALAIEALHKQVLPFIIRRMKEDVSEDLPPKIIMDYYCELSDIQKAMYESFNKRGPDIMDAVSNSGLDTGKKKKLFVFQALQYLRKLSNHPALVFDKANPDYDLAVKILKEDNSDIHDLKHAPKLIALKELLMNCGIGIKSEAGMEDDKTSAVAFRRVLIFAQLNVMLSIIETDLLKKHMPTVSYLRLDGKVPQKLRYDIVSQFNEDPSIDLLLLTTRVGGLGLTLTGADTVIFVEHDWSPMRDMQAMDRVHRIGQKSIVNVYRLITKDTIEEDIMSLQKFKLNLASSVINEKNVGVDTLSSGKVLNIFSSSGLFSNVEIKKDEIEDLGDAEENENKRFWNMIENKELDTDRLDKKPRN